MLWRSCAKPVLLVFTFRNSRLKHIATPINLVSARFIRAGYTRLMLVVDDKGIFSGYWQPTISGRKFPLTSLQTTGFRLLLIPEKISG